MEQPNSGNKLIGNRRSVTEAAYGGRRDSRHANSPLDNTQHNYPRPTVYTFRGVAIVVADMNAISSEFDVHCTVYSVHCTFYIMYFTLSNPSHN